MRPCIPTPHPPPPGQEAEGEELGTQGVAASVTWGGNGWVAEARCAPADGEPTKVRRGPGLACAP